MSIIKFTSTRLDGLGKEGKLPPDKNGYYTVVIGGLNCFNSVDEYYTADGARALFEDSSLFMRRVKSGCLKGELGHPKRQPGMTDKEYFDRILTVEETNVSSHFKEVWLDTDFGRNNPRFNNPNLISINAKVKPAGDKAEQLRASLENPDEEVCFSIRALTKDYAVRGQVYRVLTQIIAFDQVNESGLAQARKTYSPALESMSDLVVSNKMVEDLIGSSAYGLATESNKELIREIKRLVTLNQISTESISKLSYEKW
jgi:hypothetical protein